MTPFGRIASALLLLVLTVSCTDESRADDPCGGGGCLSYGGGEPHPYTTQTGGTRTNLSGEIQLTYEGETAALSCTYSTCTWDPKGVTINASLPNDWYVPDGGADADAGAGADADVDADVDASVVGSPRGWGSVGLVAFIDLSQTYVQVPGPLKNAKLVTCASRFEELSRRPNGDFVCVSGDNRPARIEAITGSIASDTIVGGEETTTTRTLHASTEAGVTIELTLQTTSSPLRTSTSTDCY